MSFAKIRPRRGTATQWTTANPILVEGEIGIEVPGDGVGAGIVNIKFGDGVTAWNDLPYGVNAVGLNESVGNKQDTITGGATTITTSNLSKNRALISSSSGKVAVSAVTSTELGYLDGVTSNIQTQINTINESNPIGKSAVHNYIKSDGSLGNIEYDISGFTKKLTKGWSASATIVCTKTSGGLAQLITSEEMYILYTASSTIWVTGPVYEGGSGLNMSVSGLTLTATVKSGGNTSRNYALLPLIGDWTLA